MGNYGSSRGMMNWRRGRGEVTCNDVSSDLRNWCCERESITVNVRRSALKFLCAGSAAIALVVSGRVVNTVCER